MSGSYANNAPSAAGATHVPRVLRVAGPALPYDRTYHLLGRLDKIRSLARAEHPDVIEAHSPYLAAAAVIACGRRTAPVRTAFWHADHVGVYVEPALARVIGERAAEAVARPLWSGVAAGLLAPFDAVFVGGVAQAAKLRAAGVRRVVHVPFGVDRSVFHPAARSEALRRDLTRGAPGALLVGVGRFAIEKRWDVVLDAFARVRAARSERGMGTTLVIYGDGPERARLEGRAEPGVYFPGFEKDARKLAAALASADVLVHGCPYETFGLSMAEAVACGLPIVVPDKGGAVESADASCSEIYRSLDADACAAAIERVLARGAGGRDARDGREPRDGRDGGDDLRARALDAASRVSTVEQHFTRVLSVYDELLRGC